MKPIQKSETSLFHVITADRYADQRGHSLKTPESTHATLADAKEHCESLVRLDMEMRRRPEVVEEEFDPLGGLDEVAEPKSWLRVLRDHFAWEEYPRIESPILAEPVGFRDYAWDWAVEQVLAGWFERLTRLESAPVETARGWFRWLHHGWLARNEWRVVAAHAEDWQDVALVICRRPDLLDERLLSLIERHAWAVGRHSLRGLAQAAWPQLSAEARGRLLAGASENTFSIDSDDFLSSVCMEKTHGQNDEWLLSYLPEARLNAQTMLEIACRAIWYRDEPLLKSVLTQGAALSTQTVRRMEPDGRDAWSDEIESRWVEKVNLLSHRVCDMVLEAATMRTYATGVKLALEHRADPTIRLWRLERSFNEMHTVPSLTLRLKDERNEDESSRILALLPSQQKPRR